METHITARILRMQALPIGPFHQLFGLFLRAIKPGYLIQILALLMACLLLVAAAPSSASASSTEVGKNQLTPGTYNLLQLPFIENRGQVDSKVAYYSRVAGGQFFLTHSGELVLSLTTSRGQEPRTVVIRESMGGADRTQPLGKQLAKTRVNYFIGADPAKWRKDIATYQRVSFGEIYPGIRLDYKASAKTIEKIFHVLPGADPAMISTEVYGVSDLEILEDGQLVLHTKIGDVFFSKPQAYQLIGGQRSIVNVAYRVAENSYSFELDEYDRKHELIIDPVLASYIGGTGADEGKALAMIGSDVIVVGVTESSSFANLDRVVTDEDVFVVRLDADLSSFSSATFLGGGGSDEPTSIAVNAATGEIYVAGFTDSTDFPDGSGGVAIGRGGNIDGFIARLNSNLSLVSARYLGGSNVDQAHAVAMRAVGGGVDDMLYVAGRTESNDFPTTPLGYDTAHGESTDDAFVTRLTPDLTIQTSTYLGHRADDLAFALAVHPLDPYDVYVAGTTSYEPGGPLTVGDFPGIDPNAFNGENDVFVARMNATLTDLISATYLGGPRIELGLALAIEPSGNSLYVAGGTICSDDPFAGSGDWLNLGDGYDYTCGGGNDAFVARLNASTLVRLSASYVGGLMTDRFYDVEIHADGSVILLGRTRSIDIPDTDGGQQPISDGWDLFLARFEPDLMTLKQATYLGGIGVDEIYGPGLGLSGIHAYVTGLTGSNPFSGVELNSAQPDYGGSVDAFVARLHYTLWDAVPATADIDVVPMLYEFGQVAVGEASPVLSLRIANLGSTLLNVYGMSFLLPTTEFTVDYQGGDGPSCNTEAFVLFPDESCTLGITYTPDAEGTDVAAFMIESDSPGEEFVNVILRGESLGELQIHGRWEIATIDSAVQSVDITVDDTGGVHLCYFSPRLSSELESTLALVYANWQPDSGKGWVHEEVDSGIIAFDRNDCEIVAASDGSIHVAYTADRQLRYTRREAGLWRDIKAVETGNVDGNIGLGVFGVSPYDVRIVYRTFPVAPDTLYRSRIAVTTDVGWVRLTTDEGDSPDDFRWNRFDDMTERFVSNRRDGDHMRLRLRELAAVPPSSEDDVLSAWVITDSYQPDTFSVTTPRVAANPFVDPTYNVRALNSIALNQLDGGVEYQLYGIKEDPLYSESIIPFIHSVIEYASESSVLAVDAHLSMALDNPAGLGDNPHQVAFYDSKDGDLKYSIAPGYTPYPEFSLSHPATPTTLKDMSLQTTEVIDSAGDVGRSVELALGGDSLPHLAYLDSTHNTIRYARQIAPSGAVVSLSPRRWRLDVAVDESDFYGFIVTNLGNQSLQILDVTISGDDWSLAEDCDDAARDSDAPVPFVGAVLEPGEYRATCAVFTPDDPTSSSGNITVATSAGPVQAQLLGQRVGSAPDDDDDGVRDEFEKGPNNNDDNYDGNGDGIADWEQSNVASFPTTEICAEDDDDALEQPNCYVTVASRDENQAVLQNVRALSREAVEAAAGGGPSGPGGHPYGYFSFTLINQHGIGNRFPSTVIIDIYLASMDPRYEPDDPGFTLLPDNYLAPAVNGYSKYGPGVREGVADRWAGNQWYDFWWDDNSEQYPPDFPLSRTVGARCAGSQPDPDDKCRHLELHLVDGELGDNNILEDGIIIDPGGPAVISAPIAGTSSGGGCFIATAAYGSELEPEVQLLRDFRDEYLSTNAVGRSLVGVYYSVSPPIAEYIATHEIVRVITRLLLTPIVYAVKYPLSAMLMVVALVLLGLAGYRLRGQSAG